MQGKLSRRDLMVGALTAGALGTTGSYLHERLLRREPTAATFIAKVSSYDVDPAPSIEEGLRSLGIKPEAVRGKSILLKPNLIETVVGAQHICTHPQVVRAAAEAWLRLGAQRIVVGEGSGHCRDMYRVLEETGLAPVLREYKIAFVDLNNDEMAVRKNAYGLTGLRSLTFPALVDQVDWIVSIAKMKTHHWAGVTLSLKNMLGLMPGIVYGWPKNVFHWAGIPQSILDINATIGAHFAIIDGVIGMEGDGPILGTPKHAGALVMGANLAAADATAARIMGIDPLRVPYLRAARGRCGTVSAERIQQRGETIAAVQTEFELLDHIPAHQNLRPVSRAATSPPLGERPGRLRSA
jgi:uncharacterized protein (DUF362 family)